DAAGVSADVAGVDANGRGVVADVAGVGGDVCGVVADITAVEADVGVMVVDRRRIGVDVVGVAENILVGGVQLATVDGIGAAGGQGAGSQVDDLLWRSAMAGVVGAQRTAPLQRAVEQRYD